MRQGMSVRQDKGDVDSGRFLLYHFFAMRQSSKIYHSFLTRVLLVFMLAAFSAPFTIFDEASAYLADTENEIVHYYLTPLPDNGEACADAPAIVADVIEFFLGAPNLPIPPQFPASAFFHPPR